MSNSSSRTVLLVGASGMLGGAIADAVLTRPGLKLRVLVRPGRRGAVAPMEARGAEPVEGDAMTPDSLPAALDGVQVVVCALPNDPGTFVPGHRNLIEAADRAGVERFVPSDFSVDCFKIRADENFNLAMRQEVAPLFEGRRIRPIHILIGAFIDTMLDPRAPFINWAGATLPYFGDGRQPCDFTSVADTARYVAAACADPAAPEILRLAGDVLTMTGFAEAISRGYGRSFRALGQGSVEDLEGFIKLKQATATNPWEWIALQYHHNMVSGRAKLDPLDNARYPEVTPESIEAFARRTGERNSRGMSHSAT